MGLALGPPRLPDTDRDVPCRPGAALLAKRPHLRETEATPDNASWIAAWSVAPPWGAWGRSHAGQAFSRDLKHQRDRAGVVSHQAEPPGSECRSRPPDVLKSVAPARIPRQRPTTTSSGVAATVCPLAGRRGSQRVAIASGTNVARPPLVDLVGHGNHRLAADRTRLPDRKKHRHRISPAPQL